MADYGRASLMLPYGFLTSKKSEHIAMFALVVLWFEYGGYTRSNSRALTRFSLSFSKLISVMSSIFAPSPGCMVMPLPRESSPSMR